MLKRFLNSFAGAAGWSAGTVVGARAGNDAYQWVKSGEAGKAVAKLGQKAADTAGEVRDELLGGDAKPARDEREADLRVADTDEESDESDLSEGDRAALRARRRQAETSVVVDCTHCGRSVQVPADAELAKCTACNQRFWVELASRG